MNKFVLSVVSVLMAFSIFAEPPEDLVTALAVSINGRVNIHVNASGDSKYKRFQCKRPEADASAWRDVSFTFNTANWGFDKMYQAYYRDVDYAGAMQYRVCETNLDGESSAWTDVGVIANSLYAKKSVAVGDSKGGRSPAYASDALTLYMFETSPTYAGHPSPLHVGVGYETPISASGMRVVPRQDQTGLLRFASNQLVAADDPTFLTNVVVLTTFPAKDELELGKVYECLFDEPVTRQYFGLRYNGSDYICVAELEVLRAGLPEPISISTDVPDWSNGFVRVSWQVPVADQCSSGCVERAVSPVGPFTRITDWSDAVAGGSFVDTSMAVGVKYFYRVRAVCAGVPYVGKELCSEPVAARRGRRLERDWSDLTKVRDGVTVIPPFRYLGSEARGETTGMSVDKVFDDQTSTFCEYKYTLPGRTQEEWGDKYRAYNGAMGVDLGGDYHIIGVAAFPRPAATATRLGPNAIWGGSDSYDTNTWTKLSQTYNEKYGSVSQTDYHWYYLSAEDDETTYRCVFLWGTKGIFEGTYCNIAEEAILGWCEQDIRDSGVLVPPSSVTAEGTAQNVTVAWTEGATVEIYEVERRIADGEWMTVAELPPEALAFTDYAAPEGAALEYRVTVHGANDEYAYSYVNASIVPGPGAAQVPPVEIVRSENVSNLAAVVSWSGCGGTYLHDGALQRSVSPYGPFTDLKELDHPVASFTMTDLTAVPGVTYYYRVRFICDDPLLSGENEVASEPVSFVRARRLERDWDDLTKLRDGVVLMYPFRYLTGTKILGTTYPVSYVFDGNISTFAEGTCGGLPEEWIPPERVKDPRAFNGAVGVDLGSDCHLVGVLAYPRSPSNPERMSITAFYGGTSETDTNTWHQLTETFNNGSAIKWCYLASTDSASLYRYAFIYAPGDIFKGFYLNVAEAGFFGWSENDAADSGLVFAPTEISVAPNTSVMVISWNAGVNVDSYLVQRRTSAAEAWTDVATLPSTALSYADGETLKKGHYEFRVVAKGADGTEAWTAVTGCDFRPKRGILLLVR